MPQLSDITSYSVDHHGLITGIIQDLGIPLCVNLMLACSVTPLMLSNDFVKQRLTATIARMNINSLSSPLKALFSKSSNNSHASDESRFVPKKQKRAWMKTDYLEKVLIAGFQGLGQLFVTHEVAMTLWQATVGQQLIAHNDVLLSSF